MVISKTAYDDDRACDGGLDAPMRGLTTRRSSRGDRDGGGVAGTVVIDVAIVYSRDVSKKDSMQLGHEGGSLRVSFIAAHWQVRLFGSSGIVYRPSEFLTVCTYVIFLCLGAWTDDPVTNFQTKHSGKSYLKCDK